MKDSFEYYRRKAKELIEAGRDDVTLLQDIDDAFNNEWTLPAEVASLPGMRKFSSTDAHDALAAAIKTLAASDVYVDVIAPAPGEDNAQLADKFQTILQHQWNLLKKRSVDNPWWGMVENAVKYGKIAAQIEHIDNAPVSGKKKKYIKRFGDYVLILHNAQSVYADYSPYALEGVLLAQKMKYLDVRNLYGEKAEELLDSTKKDESLAEDEYETEVCVYDWTDFEKRLVWAEVSDNLDGGSDDAVILKDEENKLPFINWIVRKTNDPLMKSVVETGLIENFNILLSLRYYTVAALAAYPRMWSRTPTGEGVDVDWKDVGGQVALRTGEEAGMNPAPSTDENVNNAINDTQAKLYQATQVARALTSLEGIAPGTAFSTINAMREAGVASLGEISRVLEDALEDIFCHMMYWAQYINKPMRGRRRVTADPLNSTQTRGAEVIMDLSDYEISDWEIEAEIRPDTMTDKQGRANLAIMVMERLQVGPQQAWELAGIKNGKQSHEEWKQYQMELAQLEAEKKRIIGAVDVELQNAIAQSQMAQQQQAQQPPTDQTQPQFAAAQGMDNRAGGQPVAPIAPQATREQVTGRDRGGREF